jgi:glycerophosphoryl diester phosphodiesterase
MSTIMRNMATLVLITMAAAALPAAAFDLQGHRGARGLAPENTLPAFAAALSLGVSTLELDTGVTRDGVVVIHHDPALSPDLTRGPDGRWLAERGPAIHALDDAELARYDVGRLNPAREYARRYPEQIPVDGTRVPRLSALFALVARSGNERVRFNIETKIDPRAPQLTLPPAQFARALIAEVRAAGMAARTSIQSFDWRTLAVVQAEAPEIATVYLSAQQRWLDNVAAGEAGRSAWTAGVQLAQHGSVPRMVKAAGGRVWSPFYGDLDAAGLAEARSVGLSVVVWTVNAPADIARMINLGVDGIISDRPDLVRAEMQRRGMPLPQATPVVAH